MHRNISRIVTDTCRKLEIDYQSCHLIFADAGRLGEISLELLALSDEIDCICEKYNLNGKNKLLQDDREAIHKIEHDIRNIAQKIINTNKKTK